MTPTENRLFQIWGNVAADTDVRPFSKIDTIRPDTGRNNKKHHYISVVYMKGFADKRRRVWVYRPENSVPQSTRPEAAGFINHYYSQKFRDGTQENHRFEDLWNSIELVWEETVRAVRSGRISPATSFNLLGMASIMRARVPATRERHELLLAAKMRAEVLFLEEICQLPPELERYSGQLDSIPVGVNPQQTLQAMIRELKDFGELCFQLGFEVVHNHSGLPFVTSDNPVCFYNPNVSRRVRVPYDRDKDIELVFPIDAWTLLRGLSNIETKNAVSRHVVLKNRLAVRSINKTIAQFSYKLMIGQDRSSEDLFQRYGNIVPTVATEVNRTPNELQVIWRHTFGSRPKLSPFIDTAEKAERLEKAMAGSPSLNPKSRMPEK